MFVLSLIGDVGGLASTLLPDSNNIFRVLFRVEYGLVVRESYSLSSPVRLSTLDKKWLQSFYDSVETRFGPYRQS